MPLFWVHTRSNVSSGKGRASALPTWWLTRSSRRTVTGLPPPWNWSTGAKASGVRASRSVPRAVRAARMASARFSRPQYAATVPASSSGISAGERYHAIEEGQRIVEAAWRHDRDPLHRHVLHALHRVRRGRLEGEDRDREPVRPAARGLCLLPEIGDGGGQVVQQHVDRDPAVAVVHHAGAALG